ncbi:MAG: ParB/RepB/Spo0J family partition protein [Oscillospiraceae bacterium]|nr:ParB/RepB/Spo0J family partition protein [Oscillospiraceae bacterium]
MTGYDELFMDDEERKVNALPRIFEIPLELIDDFPDHPFQVRMDEDMQQLVESVKERGLITPVILRKKDDDRYEIVSGHRRKKACEMAGMTMIKAEVRDMTRDEAIIMMVDSNLQRSQILPSEKAFAYKMKLDAMKRQGARTDLTSVPVAQKSKTSREILGEQVGESQDQVRRFVRLTELEPEILEKVDEGKIGLRPAVELSYLTPSEQRMLVDAMELTESTPSHAQAIRLRAFSKDGVLGPHIIENVMLEEKPNQKEKISISYQDARQYIPKDVPYHETKNYIFKALEFYREHYQERHRSGADRGER